ncbi:MAG: hypothetical protein H6553_02935 [Chitinophagales bacterium]|nr:hypothetical protein [Chitinophagales bacterium]
MKKYFFILIILIGLSNKIIAQAFNGAHYSTKDAILSSYINPAMPIAGDVKWQVNLIGFDANVGNNYFALDGSLKDLISNFDRATSLKQILDGKRKHMLIEACIQGPAAYFNIKNNGISIGVRAKMNATFNDFNEDLVYSLYNDFEDILNWLPSFSNERASGAVNAYHEIYFGYSRSINIGDKHAIHLGANAKLLTNIFNAQFGANNINFSKVYTSISDSAINVGESQFDFYLTDRVDDGFKYKFGINGFGIDVGAIYELKKDNSNDHYLLAGFSVNDIGKNKYTLGKNSRTFIGNNRNVPAEHLVDDEGNTKNIDEILDSLGTKTIPTGKQKINLPTALNVFVDFQVVPKFYINSNFQFNVLNYKKGDAKANAPTDISLTPRFETRIFSAFLPMNWNKYNGFNAGAGIRLAQFTVGSRNLITAFAKKEFTGIDMYLNIGFGKIEGKKKKSSSKKDKSEDNNNQDDEIWNPEKKEKLPEESR